MLGERLVARFTGRTRGVHLERAREPARAHGRRRLLLRALHAARGERARRHPPARAAALERALVARGRPTTAATGCATVRSFKLLRPVFGGSAQRALGISVLLTRPARVTVTVRRGTPRRQALSRGRAAPRAGPTGCRCRRAGCARGDYRVTIEVRARRASGSRQAWSSQPLGIWCVIALDPGGVAMPIASVPASDRLRTRCRRARSRSPERAA